jgi:hypothetical protein
MHGALKKPKILCVIILKSISQARVPTLKLHSNYLIKLFLELNEVMYAIYLTQYLASCGCLVNVIIVHIHLFFYF